MSKLTELYNKVFDEGGNVRLCGRQACIDLMAELSKYTDAPLGNMTTGTMDVVAVKKAYMMEMKNND